MFFLKKTTVKSKNESSVGEDILIVSSQASEGNEDHQQSKPGPEEAGRQPKISPPPPEPCRGLLTSELPHRCCQSVRPISRSHEPDDLLQTEYRLRRVTSRRVCRRLSNQAPSRQRKNAGSGSILGVKCNMYLGKSLSMLACVSLW